MTPQQAVGLACRLFAIWLALGSFQSWMLVRAAQSEGIATAAWLPYAVPGLSWLAAVALWFFPLSIAHRLLPRTRQEDRIALPVRQVLVVACVVLGLVVVLLRALPVLSAWLAEALLWIAMGEPLSAMDPARHAELWAGLMQLAVGLVFVLKAQPLADRILPRRAAREHVSPSMLGDSAL